MNPCKMPDVVRSGMQDTCMMNGMQVATCTAINVGRIIRRSLTRRKPIEPKSRDEQASATVEPGMWESRPMDAFGRIWTQGEVDKRWVVLMGLRLQRPRRSRIRREGVGKKRYLIDAYLLCTK